jgi:YVTN family beta-propeller protein
LNKTIQITAVLFTLFGIVSCRKDTPPQKTVFNGTITSGERVFISNEGGFGYNQATISLYDATSGNVISDIYKPNNNNQDLGDICQSVFVGPHALYAVVNNSNKVVVLDKETFQRTATISGFNSPRFFLPVSNNKAYVTDLYANAISIVDLASNSRIGTIPCPGWTEEMVESYGQVFVTNVRRAYVYVINSTNNTITDSIAVGYGSASIVKDKNEKLWVSCSGDSTRSSLPRIVRIDPVLHTVEQSFVFPNYQSSPSALKINGTGDQLYYLNSDVYSLGINATSLSPAPFILKGNKLFYALGVHPHNNDIYVSDAIDYTQHGKIMIYGSAGTFKSSFTAGIIPGGIFFE